MSTFTVKFDRPFYIAIYMLFAHPTETWLNYRILRLMNSGIKSIYGTWLMVKARFEEIDVK